MSLKHTPENMHIFKVRLCPRKQNHFDMDLLPIYIKLCCFIHIVELFWYIYIYSHNFVVSCEYFSLIIYSYIFACVSLSHKHCYWNEKWVCGGTRSW